MFVLGLYLKALLNLILFLNFTKSSVDVQEGSQGGNEALCPHHWETNVLYMSFQCSQLYL